MKESNSKFEGFAHNLIAESLKRWARDSPFVADKLKERLRFPIDELDRQIAETMFDEDGNIELVEKPKKEVEVKKDKKPVKEKKPLRRTQSRPR